MREYLHTVNRVPEFQVDGTRNFDVKLFGQPCFDVLPLDKLPEIVAQGAPYCQIPEENDSEDEESDSASSSEDEECEDEESDSASSSEDEESEDEESEDEEDDSADEAEFDVAEVLATRFDNCVLEYSVKWQNCPPEENSWEPFDDEDHQYCAKVRDFVFRHRRVRRRTDDEAL